MAETHTHDEMAKKFKLFLEENNMPFKLIPTDVAEKYIPASKLKEKEEPVKECFFCKETHSLKSFFVDSENLIDGHSDYCVQCAGGERITYKAIYAFYRVTGYMFRDLPTALRNYQFNALARVMLRFKNPDREKAEEETKQQSQDIIQSDDNTDQGHIQS